MPKDLQTLKLARKSRTYFFDIARSSNGLYLRMSCSEKTRTGFDHQRIFVFEEDLAAFMTGIKKSAMELEKLKCK
ncbi:hypothetical protein FLLO111716_13605 [Flavobacterium longum]|uniref:DUF3276 family protein n=1 Tax=Flavobacterium longum TaxID=1299340 RepID=UPI0039EA5EE9